MVRRKSNSRRHLSPGKAGSERSSTHILVNRSRARPRKSHVLQQIRLLRRSVSLLIPKAPFARLVREVISELFPNNLVNRIQSTALEALQEAAEAYLVQFFEDCVLLSLHAKRVTLYIQDMILMRRLRGRDDIINK